MNYFMVLRWYIMAKHQVNIWKTVKLQIQTELITFSIHKQGPAKVAAELVSFTIWVKQHLPGANIVC